MTDVLLPAILLVSILILAVAIRSLLSSRRSEALGEDRYELLRDQYDRLEFLREERRMLTEELERQSRERQQLAEFLGRTPPQLVEDLKREREEHLAAQRRAEQQEQERGRLEGEFRSLKAELDRYRRASARDRTKEPEANHPFWRRPIPVAGLLLGVLILWLASLMVALYLVSP